MLDYLSEFYAYSRDIPFIHSKKEFEERELILNSKIQTIDKLRKELFN